MDNNQLPDASSVTTVNFDRLLEKDDTEIQKLVTATEYPGFFYLDFSRAPIYEQARAVYACTEEYFDQPKEVKSKDARAGQPDWSDRG